MVSTINLVSENPAKYFSNVLKNNEELIVRTDSGNIVILPESYWNQMNETLKLILDKKSLQSLLEGHLSKDNNTEIKKFSVEEVFHDL